MASNSRAPALLVLVNGAPLPGVADIEVSTNSHLAAGRYRLTASLAATGTAIWTADVLSIEIRVGIDNAWTSLIAGPADRLDFDLARGEVRAEGRDLTSLFIESRTQETFENQTSSQIATTLAQRLGLTPAVTATTALVGRDFDNEHARISLDQHARVTTDWDLLIRLAEREGFDVWVAGTTLHFAPPNAQGAPLLLTPQDCASIALERTLTLSAGLNVVVKSWDCRGQRAIMQSAATKTGDGAARNYVIVRPNLTGQAAQALANTVLTQMAQHARRVVIDMPGDLTTAPRGILQLAGTNTDFDGVYVITDVERRLSFAHGFTQSVQARIPPWTISSIS